MVLLLCCSLVADRVRQYSQQDYYADNQLLQVGGYVQQVQAVADDDHNDRADERAPYRTEAAEQRGAADNAGCDGVHLVVQTGNRLCRVQLGYQNNRCDTGAQTGNGVSESLVLVNVDTGKTGCLFVAADGVDVAAELAVLHHIAEP